MNNKFKIINKKNGFTLIETMVALTIITFAILGPISLATYSIKMSTLSKNNVIASFLAQDAMEYIKNWRDNNYLNSENWLFKLNACNNSDCYLDTTIPWDVSGTAIANCAGSCPLLKYDDTLKKYNHSTGVDTVFMRKFTLEKDVSDREARISITVSWEDKFGSHSFIWEDHIFDWHP